MKDLRQHIQKGFPRFLLLLSFIFVCSFLSAQSLSVESFKMLENDLTANTTGTTEYDQNGEVAALIKIITTETGFAFDGGMMGIVKTTQKVSEIWVYVPHSIQKIKIMHQQLGQLEYYFPVPIEKARTYEMRLATARIRTIVQDEITAQFITFQVTPQNAIVTIDNKQYSLQADGSVSQLLSYGTHNYRVEAPGYFPESGVVEIGKERITREINLKSSHGTVTLDCPMKEADIYVNGTLMGTGTWTGQLDAAMYQVEVKREGYSTRIISFDLEPQEEKTISLPLPQPIYATISVTSQPNGATVYVDGVEVGTTPLIKGEILTGHRTLELRKKDYRTAVMEVEIIEGELNSFSGELIDEFTLTINTEPTGASISLNGEQKGETPYTTEIKSGDYLLRINKPGYIPYKKNVHLGGDNPDLYFKLERKILSANNVYAGGGYALGHVSGIDAYAGLYLFNVNIEAGYSKPGNASSTVWWMEDPSSWSGQQGLEYEYSVKGTMSVNAGYGILFGNRTRITPRIGAVYSKIYGKYAAGNNANMDQTSYVISGRAGIRAEYSPIPHIGIVCTPSFDIPFMKGDLATHIDATSDLIKKWCGGFSLCLGVELFF